MPNIIKTVATANKGIQEIADEIEIHKQFLIKQKIFLTKRENQVKKRIQDIVEEKIHKELWEDIGNNSLNSALEKVVLGKLSPYHIAEEIIDNYKNQK